MMLKYHECAFLHYHHCYPLLSVTGYSSVWDLAQVTRYSSEVTQLVPVLLEDGLGHMWHQCLVHVCVRVCACMQYNQADLLGSIAVKLEEVQDDQSCPFYITWASSSQTAFVSIFSDWEDDHKKRISHCVVCSCSQCRDLLHLTETVCFLWDQQFVPRKPISIPRDDME